MKIKVIILLALLALFVAAMSFRPATKKTFWKGNMHTHSYWSDGNTFPEEVAYWYQSHDYNFLVVTDHNILQVGDKWYNVDRNESTKLVYQDYLEHFGGIGLKTKKIDGQLHARLLGLDEYRDRFEKEDEFLLIAGEEISDAAEKKPIHLNAVDIQTLVDPARGTSIGECLRNNVLAINKALTDSGRKDWIIVNHPNFGWALTAQDIAQSGTRYFELYNGHPSVNNYGDSVHLNTEEMWDEVNQMRIKANKPLLLGIANDDAHHYHQFESARANPGRGWNMVRADQLSTQALYESMIRGDYYLSTGVELLDFTQNHKTCKLKIKALEGISYETTFVGLLAGKEQVEVLAHVKGSKPVYRLQGSELFVRAKVVSTKLKDNPYRPGDLEMAWLQPFQIK